MDVGILVGLFIIVILLGEVIGTAGIVVLFAMFGVTGLATMFRMLGKMFPGLPPVPRSPGNEARW